MQDLGKLVLTVLLSTLVWADTNDLWLTSGNGGQWGQWGSTVICPAGSWATSFKVRAEQSQGAGDDTAMNAIELRCDDSASTVLISSEGPWGDWNNWAVCPTGSYLSSFQLRVEPPNSDDTAANDINMWCRNKNGGTSLTFLTEQGCCNWGSYGQQRTCPVNFAVAGLQTSVQPSQGSGDDTALNDISLLCRCQACYPNGICNTNTNGCDCKAGWMGTYCTVHPPPTASNVRVYPAMVTDRTNPATLSCTYTFSAYQVGEAASVITWIHSNSSYSPATGVRPPSTWRFQVGDSVQCSVVPVDTLNFSGASVASPKQAISGTVSITGAFPVGFDGFALNSKLWYLHQFNEIDYNSAISQCTQMGGIMGTVTSDIYSPLLSTMVSNGLSNVYIGLTWTSSGYVWADGTVYDSSADVWAPNQGVGNSTLSCVAFGNPAGKFFNTRCDIKLSALCMIPQLATPRSITAYVYRGDAVDSVTASNVCQSNYGGNLVTVSTMGLDVLYPSTSASRSCDTWIGSRRQADGTFAWDSNVTTWENYWPAGNVPQNYSYNCTANSNGVWMASDCTLPKCFHCETALLNVQPTFNQIVLNKPSTMVSHLNDHLQIQVASLSGATYTAIGGVSNYSAMTQTTVSGLNPGTVYYVKVSDTDNLIPTSWMPVRTGCDCASPPNALLDGAPRNFQALQMDNNRYFTLSWKDYSACDSAIQLNRNGIDTSNFQYSDPLNCANQATKSVPLTSDDITSTAVGSSVRYCITAMNAALGNYNYKSARSCVDAVVSYIATVTGQVSAPSGGFIAGVTLNWSMAGAPMVNGTIVSASDGSFSINVRSPLLISGISQNLILVPSQITGNISHVFNYTSCPACASLGQNTFQVPLTRWSTSSITVIDTTVYTIAGTVSFKGSELYTLNAQPCYAPNAKICANVLDQNSIVCVTSMPDGTYVLNVPILTTVVVSASYATGGKNHTVEGAYNFTKISGNQIGKNFAISSTNQLTLRVGGGECMRDLTAAVMTISNLANAQNCQFQMVTLQNSIASTYNVPPFDVQVGLGQFNDTANLIPGVSYGDIGNYFSSMLATNAGYQVALLSSVSSASLTWMYKSAPQIEIHQVGTNPTCSGQFVVAGFPDIAAVNVSIRAWEEYGSDPSRNCYYKGALTFIDGLTDPALAAKGDGTYVACLPGGPGCALNLTQPLQIDTYSMAATTIVPGGPNIYAPYTKDFQVTITTPGPYIRSAQKTASVIVTGKQAMANTYSSELSVGVPSMMLFDPPGGMSYSYIAKGTTISSTMEITSDSTGGAGGEFDLMVGVYNKESTCVGFGAALCINVAEGKTLHGIYGEFEGESGKGTSTSITSQVETETVITTSQLPGIIPPYGDVVVISSISMRRSEVIVLTIDDASSPTCAPQTAQTNSWLPAVPGYSVVTIWDIVNRNIPDIEATIQTELANGPPVGVNASMVQAYWTRLQKFNTSLANWNSVLDYHARSYSDAGLRVALSSSSSSVTCTTGCAASTSLNYDTLFFTGGGTTYEFSSTMQSSQSSGSSSFSSSNNKLGFHSTTEAAFVVAAFSAEVKAFGSWGSSKETNNEDEQEDWTTVGYLLGDEQLGDKFNLKVYAHKDYGTPLFIMSSGVSMCPWQEGTVQREKVSLTINPPLLTNIPPDQPAAFNLSVINIGESREDMSFVLGIDETSNPFGLSLKLGGSTWNADRTVTLPWNVPKTFLVEAYRSSVAYDFPGISISASSPCENDMSDAHALSRDPIGSTSTLSASFLQPCAPVEWAGNWALNNDIYFLVNKGSSSQFQIQVRNPNFPTLRWASNSRLIQVQVEYRAPGSDWRVATNSSGSPIYLAEDQYGYAQATIDTTSWDLEGLYQLQVRSICNVIAGLSDSSLNQGITTGRMGRVDRTPPQLFGQFGSPADNSYWPGDDISLTFQEDLNCNIRTYPFQASLAVTKDGVTTSYAYPDPMGPYLDISCHGYQLEFAFARKLPYAQIMGGQATLSVWNVRDLAQNAESDKLTWQFKIENVGSSLLSVSVQSLQLNSAVLDGNAHRSASNDSYQEFDASFCQDLAQLLSMAEDRCRVDSVDPDGDQISVQFTILPASSNDQVSSAVLYQKFEAILADPSSIKDSKMFQNVSAENMSYKLVAPAETKTSEESVAESSEKTIAFNTFIYILVGVGVGIILIAVGIQVAACLIMRRRNRKANRQDGTIEMDIRA